MFDFRTFGPFRVPLDEYGNIPSRLDDFWDTTDEQVSGISVAKGCYIFGVRTSGSPLIRPWYVGKTINSFQNECFQPHKRNHYSRALNYRRRKVPYLYLVALLTEGGSFYKGSYSRVVEFLESQLITLAIRANDELLNARDTKLLKEVRLNGIVNGGSGNSSSRALKKTFGL